MRIPLTKYGRREIVLATAVFGAFTVIGALLWWPSAVLPAALLVYVLAFFRDPARTPEPGAFICPADGNVTDITTLPVGPGNSLDVEAVRVGVFMNVFSVHVNRSPCDGEVTKVTHRDGGYIDARKVEAFDLNEAATVCINADIDGRTVPVAVRQIAGLIARRIVTDVRVGDRLAAGEQFGMIKFGSRVELIVPAEWSDRVVVTLGQKVRAGRTALIGSASEETPS